MTNTTNYSHPNRPALGSQPSVRQPLVLGADPVWITGPLSGRRAVGDDGTLSRSVNPTISYVKAGR